MVTLVKTATQLCGKKIGKEGRNRTVDVCVREKSNSFRFDIDAETNTERI